MEIKKIRLKMREEGRLEIKKMRYFKIPLCRNFVRKSRRLFSVTKHVSVLPSVKNWGMTTSN